MDIQAAKRMLASRNGSLHAFLGDTEKHNRQRLMLAVTGEKRPLYACGYHRLRGEIMKAANIPPSITANENKAIAEWAMTAP